MFQADIVHCRGEAGPPAQMTFYPSLGVAVRGGLLLYSEPRYDDPDQPRYVRFSAAEERQIVWSGVTHVRVCGGGPVACCLGAPMRVAGRDIDEIFLCPAPRTRFLRLQARLRQVAEAINRRTAVAMALHARLGAGSELGKAGSDLLSALSRT